MYFHTLNGFCLCLLSSWLVPECTRGTLSLYVFICHASQGTLSPPIVAILLLGSSKFVADCPLAINLWSYVALYLYCHPSTPLSFPLQNMAVTDAIQKVCRSFDCNACEGILSYQLKRNNYTTDKTIILNPNEQQR